MSFASLLIENGVFFIVATGFLSITAWAWQNQQPFKLPQTLPGWFKYWFGSVQLLGTVPPLGALGWSLWQGDFLVAMVFTAYFAMLALQVLSEIVTLRQLRSVAWVMVPYLYLPYRLWQLYEGLRWTTAEAAPSWIQLILIGEIGVWGVNYLLDLAQLPRLFRWPEIADKT